MSTPSTEPRPTRPQRGEELTLHIDSLAFGGAGVARHEDSGWVVFVREALPGDTVRAVVTKRKRHYGEARLLEVVDAVARPRRAEGRPPRRAVAGHAL